MNIYAQQPLHCTNAYPESAENTGVPGDVDLGPGRGRVET